MTAIASTIAMPSSLGYGRSGMSERRLARLLRLSRGIEMGIAGPFDQYQVGRGILQERACR
jgi:hypothetical protein